MQFIKFGIVGITNTGIGYAIYVITLHLLRYFGLFRSGDIYIAQFMMFVLSVAWSFCWNNKFVFVNNREKHRNTLNALIKTYISYAFTNLFLSELLLSVEVNHLLINEFIAPIFNMLVTVPLNFTLQKFWAFNDFADSAAQRKQQ